MKGIDRYWFLTPTTWGQWLPGDPRGSVSRENVSEESHRQLQNELVVPYSESMPELNEASRKRMKGIPIFLTPAHTERLLSPFQETGDVRKWLLVGTAVMPNHWHFVVRPENCDQMGE